MVVDDNSMNQLIVRKMIENVPVIKKHKVKILVSSNGLEALEAFKEEQNTGATKNMNKVKLILMDCEMPVMDGYEASKKIRDFENLNL